MKIPQWSEITAPFGGRFDPPHLGHREAVRGLFQYPRIKQVLIVPSATPPHKPVHVSSVHRTEMARLNFQSTSSDSFPSEVRLDLQEIERNRRQPHRPSYAYDTLQELRPQFSQLAFVIGADQLCQLPTWYRFPEVLSLAHWIVLDRKSPGHLAIQNDFGRTLQDWTGSGLIQQAGSSTWHLKSGSTFLTVVPTDAPAVSSTAIREALVKNGAPQPGTLLPEVLGYLKVHRLYGIP